MKTVYKYELQLNCTNQIWMPTNGQIIHVAEQHNYLMMWVYVDQITPHSTRYFRVWGTGFMMPEDYDGVHVGTALTVDGNLVWHVFEQKDNK